jgi:hypothetical protein
MFSVGKQSDLTDLEVDTYEDIELNNGSFSEQFNTSHSIEGKVTSNQLTSTLKKAALVIRGYL